MILNQQTDEMNEKGQDQQAESSGSDFKELLDTHNPTPMRRGQIVEGEIIHLDENMAIVDVGAKRDAIVTPEEMDEVDEEFLDSLNEGDNVHVYVTRTPFGDEDLLVSIQKGLRERDWTRAEEYLDNQEVVELKVIGKNKGGLLVEFGQLQGFVPNSHVPRLASVFDRQERKKTKSDMINSTVSAKVMEIDRSRRRLILSAKEAREERRQKRFAELKEMEGETVTGRVTNLVDFGAFIDLDGAEGLLHISEIAWEKVDNPSDWLNPGDEIEILIKSVDEERERISLSRKELLPSPWNVFDDTHEEGDLVEGVVTNVVDFGAFVHVDDGIEGLIHVSEINGMQDFLPKDILTPGDTILVRILDIQPERQRLALSQRRVGQEEEMEWIWGREQQMSMNEDEEE